MKLIAFLLLSSFCIAQGHKSPSTDNQFRTFLGLKLGVPLKETEKCEAGDTFYDDDAKFCWSNATENSYIGKHGDVYLEHLAGMIHLPVFGTLVGPNLEMIWIVVPPDSFDGMLKGLTASLGAPRSKRRERYSNSFGGIRYGSNVEWVTRGLSVGMSELGNGGEYGWVVVSTPTWDRAQAAERKKAEPGKVF